MTASRARLHESTREALTQLPAGVLVLSYHSPAGEAVHALVPDGSIRLPGSPARLLVPMPNEAGTPAPEHGAAVHASLLAAGQEALMIRLLRHQTITSEEWRLLDDGVAVPAGAAAYFSCVLVDQHHVGERVMLVLEVDGAEIGRQSLPLLSFQGGIGNFAPGTMIDRWSGAALEAQRLAELAAEPLDLLTSELRVEGSIMTVVDGTDLIPLSVTKHSTTARSTRLGFRVPFVPPIGGLLVGSSAIGVSREEWLSRAVGTRTQKREAAARLDRCVARGWSIVLVGKLTAEELDPIVYAYADVGRRTPEEAALLKSIADTAAQWEPEEVLPDRDYEVLNLMVPLRGADGEALAMVVLNDLPSGASGTEIQMWLSMMQNVVRDVEERAAAERSDDHGVGGFSS